MDGLQFNFVTSVDYRVLFGMDTWYTLIAVADCFGFVLSACEVVTHKYKEKPVDTDRFVEFVRNSLVPFSSNYLREETYSVVIMDNCSIHLDRRVRKLIEGAGAIILFCCLQSGADSRQCSVNGKRAWKGILLNAMTAGTKAALGSITPQQGLNFFSHTTLVHLVLSHPLSGKFRDFQLCLAIDDAGILKALDFM